MNQMPYAEARKLVEHPVACIDCHDPQTMQLRVTRPGFLEGIRALKAVEGSAATTTSTRMATRQEMRSFVCGQCHVEYYFKGAGEAAHLPVGARASRSTRSWPTTTRPASRTGRTPRPARRCSRRSTPSSRCGTRASTRAPASPAPTATCRTSASGAMKISDHHVRSPLLNINRACQTCHKWSEEELQAARRDDPGPHLRAAQPRDGRAGGADRATSKAARGAGAHRRRSSPRRATLQRAGAVPARLRRGGELDGLPRRQEAARILGESIDYSRRGQVALRDVPLKKAN